MAATAAQRPILPIFWQHRVKLLRCITVVFPNFSPARRWLSGLIRLIPTQCPVCELETRRRNGICETCEAQLPWIDSACWHCGLPAAEKRLIHGRCGRCLINPPNYDSCTALFHYHPPINKLIARFKFHGRLELGSSLGQLLAKQFFLQQRRTNPHLQPQLLLPVPLHRKRRNQRGFNQSLELTKEISGVCSLPISNTLVRRIRCTAPQTEMKNAKGRRKNLTAAFAMENSKRRGEVKRVALIDDVVTTGATVSAVTASLKQAGIERVDVWCLARACL